MESPASTQVQHEPARRVRWLRRPGIPARIFAGFALVSLTFASVAGVSLWEHQRTAFTLRVLHEGYLPLSLSV
ncbi:MAG TPA: hypothetical protein VI299_18995, partial [Polyangiales bacterium]